MLDRLLLSLYSALDRAPNARTALRVQHPDGFRWNIERRVLTAETEAGALLGVIELQPLSISALASRLAGLGCSVAYLDADIAARSAGTLLRGSGAQSQSNGDALQAYDSLLWSVFDAYAVELEQARDSVDSALAQLYLSSAEGEWLDLWGEFFALPRNGMDDVRYRKHLIDETLRQRVNGVAIEQAIADVTGKRVSLREPWREMFVLGASAMDGDHRMHDGRFYTYHVIQPVTTTPIDWSDVLPVIDRNRAAGTQVAPPLTLLPVAHVAVGVSSVVSSQRFDAHVGSARLRSDFALSSGRLSVDGYTINNPMAAFTINNLAAGPLAAQVQIWPPRTVSKAAVTLSDLPALGELNARFGLGYDHRDAPATVLSVEGPLSDDPATVIRVRADEVIDTPIVSVAVLEDPVGLVDWSLQLRSSVIVRSDSRAAFGTEQVLSMAASYDGIGGALWRGSWDSRTWANAQSRFSITHWS